MQILIVDDEPAVRSSLSRALQLKGYQIGTAAAGEVTWSVIGPALVWVVALIVVLIPLHARVSSRRR